MPGANTEFMHYGSLKKAKINNVAQVLNKQGRPKLDLKNIDGVLDSLVFPPRKEPITPQEIIVIDDDSGDIKQKHHSIEDIGAKSLTQDIPENKCFSYQVSENSQDSIDPLVGKKSKENRHNSN